MLAERQQLLITANRCSTFFLSVDIEMSVPINLFLKNVKNSASLGGAVGAGTGHERVTISHRGSPEIFLCRTAAQE